MLHGVLMELCWRTGEIINAVDFLLNCIMFQTRLRKRQSNISPENRCI